MASVYAAAKYEGGNYRGLHFRFVFATVNDKPFGCLTVIFLLKSNSKKFKISKLHGIGMKSFRKYK